MNRNFEKAALSSEKPRPVIWKKLSQWFKFIMIYFFAKALMEKIRKPKTPIQAAESQVPIFKGLRGIFEETDIRSTRFKKIEIIDYEPSQSDSTNFLVPSGTITIFMGKPTSSLLNELKNVVEQDKKRDVELSRKLKNIYKERKVQDWDTAVKLLKAQNIVAEIVYGRLTLATNLFVPDDLEISMIPLPYNGGAILPDGLEILERIKHDEKEELSVFAVRHAPKLSKAEEAAINLISQDQIEFNIGKAAMCYAVTAVTVVAVVIAGTYACPGSYDDIILDEILINQIGPDATAKQLLAVRRKILENKR